MYIVLGFWINEVPPEQERGDSHEAQPVWERRVFALRTQEHDGVHLAVHGKQQRIFHERHVRADAVEDRPLVEVHRVARGNKLLLQPEGALAFDFVQVRVSVGVVVVRFHLEFAEVFPFEVADGLHLDPDPQTLEVDGGVEPVKVPVVVVHLLQGVAV